MSRELKFSIDSDLDFYCFLRAHLPVGYTIVSEPQKSYYSEWDFCYRILKDGVLLAEYTGDFRKIEKGFLVEEARQILEQIEATNDHRE